MSLVYYFGDTNHVDLIPIWQKIIIIVKSRDVREVSYQKITGKQITDLLLIASFIFHFSGVYEALELRDGGSDYLGKGVLKVSYD